MGYGIHGQASWTELEMNPAPVPPQQGFHQGDAGAEEQAGFFRIQKAPLHIITEQSLEWQSPLFICFIDFKQAYEMVDRNNGMQQKLINRIQSFCMDICNNCIQERSQARVSPVADNLFPCD